MRYVQDTRDVPPPLRQGRSGRPAWIEEWIRDLGRYVKLECGHIENINFRGTTIVGTMTVCERGHGWVNITRAATLHEYFDIPRSVFPTVPPF